QYPARPDAGPRDTRAGRRGGTTVPRPRGAARGRGNGAPAGWLSRDSRVDGAWHAAGAAGRSGDAGAGACGQSAAADGHVVALLLAIVELARAADLLLRIGDHFLPLRDPAHGAAEGEDRREHRCREADRVEDDARIEIDVGIELARHEILVVERDLLEFPGDLQRGREVVRAELLEHLVGRFLHDLGARVVVLVD